jgi:hypothetical protein
LELLYDSKPERLKRRRQLEAEAARVFDQESYWSKTQFLASKLLELGSLSGKQATKLLTRKPKH